MFAHHIYLCYNSRLINITALGEGIVVCVNVIYDSKRWWQLQNAPQSRLNFSWKKIAWFNGFTIKLLNINRVPLYAIYHKEC